MSEIKTLNLKLKCKVFEEVEYFPLTGTFDIEQKVSGFIYDRTYASSKNNLRTQIKDSIGGFEYNLIEGSTKKHWDGGLISGCSFEFFNKEKFKWTPRISEGQYTIFDKTKNFYSDASNCKLVESNEIVLPPNALENSIEIALYKRDNDYNNIPLYKWNYSEHDNVFNNKLYYNLTKSEESLIVNLNKFLVKNSYFDLESYSELLNVNNIDDFLENKGIGNDSFRLIYTNCFPILPGEIQLLSVLDNVIYEWTLVENINTIYEEDSNRFFQIDYERGIIKTSGLNILENFSIVSFNQNNKSLELNKNLDIWPTQGVFKFNDNYFSYEGKDKRFLHQIKSLSDSGLNFLKGEIISFAKQGYAAPKEETFYINYIACPRIDYQFYDSYRLDRNLNLKPLYMTKPNGILQISPQEKHVASILLECNKFLNNQNIYESLYLGNDTAILKATCFNGNGKPVNEVLVTFENLSEDLDLKFEGDSSSISNLTNVFGFTKTSILVPFSSSESLSLNSNQVDGNKIVFENISKMIAQDITLFQILAYNGIEKINQNQIAAYENLSSSYKPPLIERLVYRWNDEVLNPTSGLNGAYTIIKPIDSNSNSLTFDTDLPVCINENAESIVYKYKIYFSRVAKLQAKCIDPASGNLIKSNEILLRIDLPLHMKGINTLGIPYGFGFKNNIGDPELKVLGTGLGGANFITINPNVENIFNIRVSE